MSFIRILVVMLTGLQARHPMATTSELLCLVEAQKQQASWGLALSEAELLRQCQLDLRDPMRQLPNGT
jgi:hypothetical protein